MHAWVQRLLAQSGTHLPHHQPRARRQEAQQTEQVDQLDGQLQALCHLILGLDGRQLQQGGCV
jgi:hypothetical protein